jgi:hypothetical protein
MAKLGELKSIRKDSGYPFNIAVRPPLGLGAYLDFPNKPKLFLLFLDLSSTSFFGRASAFVCSGLVRYFCRGLAFAQIHSGTM